MITAGQLRKGAVVRLDGAHWIVEDHRTIQSGQRHGVLHLKLRNMKTGHVAEKSLDEADRIEQPEVEARRVQFLYEEHPGFVFMDSETFDQITVPEGVVGQGRWLLEEGEEFTLRLLDGRPVELVLPPVFVDEVVETAAPMSGHGGATMKDARLACGLVIKAPQFIEVGDRVKVDTESHRYHGKESGKT
jgi:elongation factor P